MDRSRGRARLSLRDLIGITLAIALSSTPSSAESIPSEIIKRAEAYIASKVGSRYATSNYVIVPEESTSSKTSEGEVEYFLSFRFLPAERLGATDARVFVRVFSDPEFVPYDWVATLDESGSPVDPVVTREEAIAILATLDVPGFDPQAVSGSLRRPSHLPEPPWFQGWTWVLKVPQQNPGADCPKHYLVSVNAVSGSAKNLGLVTDCPELRVDD